MLNGWNAKHTLAAAAMLLVFGLVLVLVLRDGGDEDSPEATATPTPSATTAATTPAADPDPDADPADDAPLIVAPGRVGAAKVGMSKSQAAATGLFNTDVDHGADDCRGVSPLEWKHKSLDVLTEDDGSIAAMGITSGGPKTAEGIGVGSTFQQVRDAYADLTPIEEAGFDQSGNYIVVGGLYLGFLYDENPFDTTDSTKVAFMEVDDQKPELIRDGC